MKRFLDYAKKIALLAGGVFAAKAVLSISVPLPDPAILPRYAEKGGGLLGLYNYLSGGALAAGSVFALGLMPYLSARSFMYLARKVSVRAGGLDRIRERWWTRALTVTLSIVQSIGYAVFTQNLPGAVTEPGVMYTAQVIVMLTSVSTLLMLFAEEAISAGEEEEEEEEEPLLLNEPAVGDRYAKRERSHDPLYVSHPTPLP